MELFHFQNVSNRIWVLVAAIKTGKLIFSSAFIIHGYIRGNFPNSDSQNKN